MRVVLSETALKFRASNGWIQIRSQGEVMKPDFFMMKRLVMMGVLFFLVVSGFRSPVRAEEVPADPGSDPVQYVIDDIQGSDVRIMEDGANVWDKAVEGQVLEKG